MLFLFLSVTCSVAVSVLLKLFRGREINLTQAITWNYFAASVLCFIFLKPSLASILTSQTPWFALLALSALLPTLFLVMATAIRDAGIVRSDIAQRLSLLLSLTAAFVLFHETISIRKAIGIGLGLLAILSILSRPERQLARSKGAAWPLLGVFAGYALVDVLLKTIALRGTAIPSVLLTTFALAFLGMLFWQWRKKRTFLRTDVLAGLGLGTLNFGNIIFYIKAHRALPTSPAVVFATMNIGVVIAGTLIGILFFRERTSLLNRIGIGLSVLAIAIIASS
jgi:drug/metabolite transporter (DMT)-like permease